MNHYNKIVLSGFYGFDNSGDDAILKAIIDHLRTIKPEVDLTVLSYDPEKTKKIYNVKSAHRFKFFEVIKTIRNCDLLISGGGSLLQDITSTRSILYYLFIIKLGKIFGKKVMVYANGIGPIKKSLNQKFTRKVLNQVDYITLRDEDSLNFIKSLNVTNKNIELTADPVFALKTSDSEQTKNIFNKMGISETNNIIGFSLRDWKTENNFEDEIVTVINSLAKEKKYKFVIVPMHFPEDLSIAKRIKEKVNTDEVYLVDKNYQAEEIINVISHFKIMIAMRLHSLIYAASRGVPVVAISYDPKVKALMQFLDMESSIDINKLSSEELLKNIRTVLDNREEIKLKLEKNNNYRYDRAIRNAEIAINLLNEG